MSMEAMPGPGDAGPDAQTRRRAESALAALVETGDLDRLVQLARVVGSAQDALSDDIVGRLAGTAADGLDLLDRVNRSGIARALPAIAALVESGDLDRVVQLARVVGSAQDAASDDIVSRLADLASRAICLLDRVTRDDAIGRLLDVVERGPAIQVLGDFFECLDHAGREARGGPPARGGIGGLWSLIKQPENQEALRFMLAVARQLRAGCIARSAAGGAPQR